MPVEDLCRILEPGAATAEDDEAGFKVVDFCSCGCIIAIAYLELAAADADAADKEALLAL